MKNYIVTLLLFIFIGATAIVAQPSPDQLAEQMQELNQQRLANIQSLEMTIKMNVAGFETETHSRYVRTETDGRYELVLEEGDDPDSDLMDGVYDGSIEEIVRNAESVSNDNVDGKNSYRLVIRDREFLRSLSDEEIDADEVEVEFEKATIWIDSNNLVPLKMVIEQFENEEGLTIEMIMEDYRDYSGLPVAHKMSMNVEGMDQVMSDEDIAEARRAMQQFEEQLEQMPPAQRDMIRNQMSGQIEKFEQMLESGMASSTFMEVVDVKINQ